MEREENLCPRGIGLILTDIGAIVVVTLLGICGIHMVRKGEDAISGSIAIGLTICMYVIFWIIRLYIDLVQSECVPNYGDLIIMEND